MYAGLGLEVRLVLSLSEKYLPSHVHSPVANLRPVSRFGGLNDLALTRAQFSHREFNMSLCRVEM